MATKIKPTLSEKNKYWISKHRHYELKHFCLQYPMWTKIYSELDNPSIPLSTIERLPSDNIPGDPTSKRAILKSYYRDKIKLIEDTAKKADQYLDKYILKAVTEEVSYTYLKSKLDIPCGREMYYDRYRRFFWLLNKARD